VCAVRLSSPVVRLLKAKAREDDRGFGQFLRHVLTMAALQKQPEGEVRRAD
jgi:hypothetical protein